MRVTIAQIKLDSIMMIFCRNTQTRVILTNAEPTLIQSCLIFPSNCNYEFFNGLYHKGIIFFSISYYNYEKVSMRINVESHITSNPWSISYNDISLSKISGEAKVVRQNARKFISRSSLCRWFNPIFGVVARNSPSKNDNLTDSSVRRSPLFSSQFGDC